MAAEVFGFSEEDVRRIRRAVRASEGYKNPRGYRGRWPVLQAPEVVLLQVTGAHDGCAYPAKVRLLDAAACSLSDGVDCLAFNPDE